MSEHASASDTSAVTTFSIAWMTFCSSAAIDSSRIRFSTYPAARRITTTGQAPHPRLTTAIVIAHIAAVPAPAPTSS